MKAAKTGLEGLTEEQLKEIDQWLKFYHDSKEYFFVGYYPSSPAADAEAKAYLK